MAVLYELRGEIAERMGVELARLLGGVHRGAHAGAGEQLEQQRVGRDAVDDVSAEHARIERVDARLQLGDHARGHDVVLHHILGLEQREVRDERVFVLEVLVEAVDVGEEDHLVRADGGGDMAGHHVGVHVVEAAVLAERDRGDDGDVVAGHEIVEKRAVERVICPTRPDRGSLARPQ